MGLLLFLLAVKWPIPVIGLMYDFTVNIVPSLFQSSAICAHQHPQEQAPALRCLIPGRAPDQRRVLGHGEGRGQDPSCQGRGDAPLGAGRLWECILSRCSESLQCGMFVAGLVPRPAGFSSSHKGQLQGLVC